MKNRCNKMEQNGAKWKINGFGFPVKDYEVCLPACLPSGTVGTAILNLQYPIEVEASGSRKPRRRQGGGGLVHQYPAPREVRPEVLASHVNKVYMATANNPAVGGARQPNIGRLLKLVILAVGGVGWFW